MHWYMEKQIQDYLGLLKVNNIGFNKVLGWMTGIEPATARSTGN